MAEEFDSNRVYDIPLSEIYTDEEFNCRGRIDPVTVMDLAKSIAERGLDSPVLTQVYSNPSRPTKKFKLVAGYRRFKAHQMNKSPTIRALVRPPMKDIEARVLNLTENLQREDLNIQQEANAIDHFRRAGWSEADVSRKIAKSRGWVQQRYKFLELPNDIQDEIVAGMISQAKILALWSLGTGTEEQYELAKRLKDQKLLGKKREPKPEDVIKRNEKRVRSTKEIFDMQDNIRHTMGSNNFATRALAWAAGEISDLEMHKEIAAQAHRAGKFYVMPEGIQGTHAKVTA